jgi:hypothetical protein
MEINVKKSKMMRISRQPPPVQILIDQKHPENMENFSYLSSMIKNDTRCIREIEYRIAMTRAALNKKRSLFNSNSGLNVRKKLLKFCIRNIVLFVAETWTHQKVDQK